MKIKTNLETILVGLLLLISISGTVLASVTTNQLNSTDGINLNNALVSANDLILKTNNGTTALTCTGSKVVLADGLDVGGTMNFTGGGQIQNGKLGTNLNTNGLGLQYSTGTKDLKIQGIVDGLGNYFRVITNDETNEVMRIYNGSTGVYMYKDLTMIYPASVNLQGRYVTGANAVYSYANESTFFSLSETNEGLGLRTSNAGDGTQRRIYVEGNKSVAKVGFEQVYLEMSNTKRPTTPAEGNCYWNNTAGYHCWDCYNSTNWICYGDRKSVV